MPLLPDGAIPDWMYWTQVALGNTFTDITDLFVEVIPIALAVGGVYFAIRHAWRASKSLTR